MKTLFLFITAIVVLLFAPGCEQKPEGPYPQRDIFVYIFSSQGGGTDAWIRQLSALMAEDLGVNLVCANLPGAKGGTGAMKVWNGPHDGYALLGASETSTFFGINDVAPMVDKWRFFIAGGSPGALAVHKDSPFQSIEDLAIAVKDKPSAIKVSNSGRGKLWHIKAVQMEQALGGALKHIPYNGSGPAVTALLSREVDAVSCSCAEMSEYVKAGLLRPLVVTDADPMTFEGYGPVRSIVELYPNMQSQVQSLFQWLGFMLPHDVPTDRAAVFEAAFLKALNSPQFAPFLDMQMARKMGYVGTEAQTLASEMQSIASWTAHELGVARKDPATLGIPKPKTLE